MNTAERDTIERSLFDWEDCDNGGIMDAQYYDVVLKVPFGEFSIGTKFDCAAVSGSYSIIELFEYVNEEPIFLSNFSFVPN